MLHGTATSDMLSQFSLIMTGQWNTVQTSCLILFLVTNIPH